jgi:hypothetical protein
MGLRKAQPKTSPAEVPILTYGDNIIFLVFQQVLSMVALEKRGNSARFITTGKAYEPAEINMEAFDLANDPHKLILDELREATKSRHKAIAKFEEDEPSVYAFIYRHLSNESLDAIKLLKKTMERFMTRRTQCYYGLGSRRHTRWLRRQLCHRC